MDYDWAFTSKELRGVGRVKIVQESQEKKTDQLDQL